MPDQQNNISDQLVEAMKHHQRTTDISKEARRRLALMEQLAQQIEQLPDSEPAKKRVASGAG